MTVKKKVDKNKNKSIKFVQRKSTKPNRNKKTSKHSKHMTRFSIHTTAPLKTNNTKFTKPNMM